MLHGEQVSWLMWLRAGVIGVLLLTADAAFPQDPPNTTKSEPNYEFFSGEVEDVSDNRIVVSRVLPGKPTETRSFVMNQETKMEGKPTPKARVTVGFKTTDEGDVAVRIIVRPRRR